MKIVEMRLYYLNFVSRFIHSRYLIRFQMEHLSKFCLLLLTFLFFSAITAVAQSGSSIEQLENEMRSAAGAARVQKLIELADACLAEGQYKEALQWAEEAEGFAKKLKLPEWRAAALNREGKALTYVDKRSLFGKEKAAPRFTQSNEILQQTRSNIRSGRRSDPGGGQPDGHMDTHRRSNRHPNRHADCHRDAL